LYRIGFDYALSRFTRFAKVTTAKPLELPLLFVDINTDLAPLLFKLCNNSTSKAPLGTSKSFAVK